MKRLIEVMVVLVVTIIAMIGILVLGFIDAHAEECTQRSCDPVMDSIVKIRASVTITQDGKELTEVYGGTGFIISDVGLIMTAAHVVDVFDELKVFLPDDPTTERDAVVIVADNTVDIAILFISDIEILISGYTNSKFLTFCKDAQIYQLLAAYAWRETIVERTVGRFKGQTEDFYWETDVIVRPGFSGGPMYDYERKCVIGITVAMYDTSMRPRSFFVRPESSEKIMEILQHFPPFKK